MVSVDAILALKKQIKTWEYNFQEKENRQPNKADIKADPAVYKLYKVYRAAKSKTQLDTPHKTEEHSTVIQKQGIVPKIEIDIADPLSEVESDYEELKSDIKTTIPNMELGPTPQANGKVLSILDFRLTPPESSPLKSKTSVKREAPANNDLFKTPTKKVKKIELMDSSIRSQPNNNIAMKLQLASNEDYVSPVKPKAGDDIESITLETPRYLSRNTRKFNFTQEIAEEDKITYREHEEITSSPLGKNLDLGLITPTKSSKIPLTPTKTNPLNFSVSPSPLKTQRFLTRKLSEIFYNNKEIPEEEYVEEEILENIDSATEDATSKNTVIKKKSKTQKRTTRRWKIKPRMYDEVDDRFKDKNIHDEIKKIDESNYEELIKYMGSDDGNDKDCSEGDSEDNLEEEMISKNTNNNTVGKIKPISMNYQRSKINDARSKAFKRRMKNR